jgi:hypothetical protein
MRFLLLLGIAGCIVGCQPSETATRPTDYKGAPRGDADAGSGPGKNINTPPEPK